MADESWGPGEDEASFAASAPRADRPIGAAELLAMHDAASAAGRRLEALLALARHAGRAGDASRLVGWLGEHAARVDEDAAFEEARSFVMMSNHSLFGAYPHRARAALPPSAMSALVKGADPTRVLRQLAILCDQYGVPCVAADLIDAVVALRPGWIEPLFNRALIKMSLGDFFAARGDVKTMREAGQDGWEMLQQYLQHLAGEWTFFPTGDDVAGHAPGDAALRDGVARPGAAEIAERWDELAAHLGGLRARLVELAEARDIAPSFLPPEVDGVAGEVGDEAGIPDLLLDARRTWAALCALAWVSGHAEVARPAGPALADRAERLHGWVLAGLDAVRAIAEGDEVAGATITWTKHALARFDPQFVGITLVSLFESLAEVAGWLVGAELSDDDDDDDEDSDEADESDEDDD
jgi:hypothetical protein